MSKFKIGDWVTCIRDEYKGMFKGSILKVSECGTDFVRFGSTAMYNPSLFEVVKVMKHDFKVGDWVKKETWDEFYEVVAVESNRVRIITGLGFRDWYDTTVHALIKKKEESMKLEVGGKYRMVGTHEPVRVICTDRKSSGASKDFTCISLVCNNEFENTFLTTVEGKNTLGEVLFEEVPEFDWSKVQVDTPIWVAEKNYSKDYQTNTVLIKRHFADYSPSTGRVYFYYGGATSHTTDQPVQSEIAANCYLEKPKV